MGLFGKNMVEVEVKQKKFNPKILFYILVCVNVVNLIDAITTYIATNKGYQELNPILNSLFQAHGILPHLILKVLIVGLGSIVLYKVFILIQNTDYKDFKKFKTINPYIVGKTYSIVMLILTISLSLISLNNLMLLGG